MRSLAEAFRVLKLSGLFAVSNRAPPSDPYRSAWSECLAAAVTKAAAEHALAEVAPWEDHFSKHGNLESALTQIGFSVVRPDAVECEADFTTIANSAPEVASAFISLELTAGPTFARQRMTRLRLVSDLRFGTVAARSS